MQNTFILKHEFNLHKHRILRSKIFLKNCIYECFVYFFYQEKK